ncbi:MAG: hypothetical protein ACTSXJ_05950 [Candidatus Baldrarchaeia archaeon]
MQIEAAYVELYRVFPLMYIIESPEKLKSRFKFLGDSERLLRKYNAAEKSSEKRVIDYIESFGALRINVHAAWNPTHKTIVKLTRRIRMPIRHMVPMEAKAQRSATLRGASVHSVVIHPEVKIFPFGACSIHMRITLQGKMTTEEMLHLLRGEDYKIRYSPFGVVTLEEFFERAQDAVIYSLYEYEYQEEAKVNMGPLRHMIHVIKSSNTIKLDEYKREIYALVTMDPDWENAEDEKIDASIGQSLGKTPNDIVVIGEHGAFTYTPALKGSKPRRTFREAVINSIEVAQAQLESLRIVKQRLKTIKLKEGRHMPDMVRTFSITLNPYFTPMKLLPRVSWRKYYKYTVNKIHLDSEYDEKVDEVFYAFDSLPISKEDLQELLKPLAELKIPKISERIMNILGEESAQEKEDRG